MATTPLPPSPLRAEPVDPEQYAAQRDGRAERAMREGWSRAYARQNQLLPYAGTTLTPGQVDRLTGYLDLADRDNRRDRLSAALLSAMLTTGRSLPDLAAVRVEGPGDKPPSRPALVVDAEWTWWLEPGAPSSEQRSPLSASSHMEERHSLIPLPCSARTRRLLEPLLHRPAAGPVFPGTTVALLRGLRRTLAGAHVDASVRMVEGWLFHQLARMAGGDVALAALVTGHMPVIARSVIHYTRVDAANVPTWLKRALAGIDTIAARKTAATAAMIGSRYAPTAEQVRGLVENWSAPLREARGARHAVRATHNALTLHTFLFFYLATGCRPSGQMIPDPDTIDPSTGFLIVDDKPSPDNFKSRLIWVSEECRDQLRWFQRHQQRLASRFAGSLPEGPFLLDIEHRPSALTSAAVRKRLHAVGWPFPVNAGRHFLRSALLGRVTSEALHAFLGHWHLGTDPWGPRAAMDPLAYRAELAAHLPPLLRSAGLVPRRGLA